jgi:CTP:molybdopterin cytidylyltransferase MocA
MLASRQSKLVLPLQGARLARVRARATCRGNDGVLVVSGTSADALVAAVKIGPATQKWLAGIRITLAISLLRGASPLAAAPLVTRRFVTELASTMSGHAARTGRHLGGCGLIIVAGCIISPCLNHVQFL